MSRLSHLSGIESCILATTDGLLIDSVGDVESPDVAAAVCTYILQSTRRLQQIDSNSAPDRLTMESGSTSILVQRLDHENVLIVTLRDSSNLAYVRWLLDGAQ